MMRFVWIAGVGNRDEGSSMWAMYGGLAENVEVEQCMGVLLQGGKSKK